MNIGWQEFLSFYTGLNVARKEYDERFQKKKVLVKSKTIQKTLQMMSTINQ